MHFFLKKFAHVHFLLYLCTLFRAFAYDSLCVGVVNKVINN